MERAPATGSIAPSCGARSTTCSNSRVRCRWRRKRWPSPAPSAAPSIKPGISATTKLIDENRSFVVAGNIGDDEAAVLVDPHDAQMRSKGRERIIRDARPRGGDRAYQCRFASVGYAEETHIGEHLELHFEPPLLAGFARCRLPRRPVGARLEMQIAQTALTAPGEQRTSAVLREIGHELAGFGVGDHGADRHAQH